MGRKRNEEGAIVIEATMALPVYMFLIITILTIVNICYVQAKIQIAINTAAKQISECMYIYYATGVSDAVNQGGGKSSATTEEISTFITDLLAEFEIENETLNNFSEALGGTSLAGLLEDGAMTLIIQPIVESVLKNAENDTAGAFYSRRGIVGTPQFIAQLRDDALLIGMHYEVEVIKLLNMDLTFEMFNVATTGMWGNSQ